jgi:hypothetical protein
MMANPSFLSIQNQFRSFKSHTISVAFMKGLFKEELHDNHIDLITFLEVQRRLDCVDRWMRLSNSQETLSHNLASEWRNAQAEESKKLHFRREDLLMEADAAWIPEFTKLFSSAFVDELAGLCVIGRPGKGSESQDADERPQAEGQEVKDADGKQMGSAFEIRKCLAKNGYQEREIFRGCRSSTRRFAPCCIPF